VRPHEPSRSARLRRPVMPPTGSSSIAVALASSFVVHAGRGLPSLTVKLVAGHGTGRKRKPRPVCLDAAKARGRAPGRPCAWRPWMV
jgi:hypothetical protein